MRKIGFKNFKRFASLAPMELSPVTILVGRNNAGKSSFIKGLLLASENINNLFVPYRGFLSPLFSFDLNVLNAGISTFGRNYKYDATGEMQFIAHYGFVDEDTDVTLLVANSTRFIVSLSIGAADKREIDTPSFGRVTKLEIEDRANLLKFVIKFNTRRMSMSLMKPANEKEEELRLKLLDKGNGISLLEGISQTRAELSRSESVREEWITVDMPLENLLVRQVNPEDIKAKTAIGRYIENFIFFFQYLYERKDKEDIFEMMSLTNMSEWSDKDAINVFFSHSKFVENSYEMLEEAIRTPNDNLLNIHTYDITRSVLYNTKDKNDFMAESILRYQSTAFENDVEPMREYILGWMDEFEIGSDFRINNVAGEYYSLEVEVAGGVWAPLSDLGTGANKLMIMLLNLAVARQRKTFSYNKPIVVIEEPEQNLHPNHQSKLADLFASVSDKVNLVVETHSEYLVRKTQLLVAKEKYSLEELKEKNPFKVYYFPKDGMPYDMEYQTNGKFNKPMDKGFLDVAAFLALDVLKAGKKK